ncbi:hypothetical protein BLA60_19670 [Actinophytocola xinjiangensis]|uniref:PH (Pleckstrin Homology) domain-containing protein n=1 Tax=Actinophytocola xinjiangensis TaxID=485602 RepID=A0A7Z1AY90_9PSEU|nr:hypothetical protein [Actinophytocola xinjiangensis]OLF09392.1 hypothetical protein BLA60_19670 [Actinophytocola xinjiangensis]
MKVGYNPTWAVVSLVLGAMLAALAIIGLSNGEFNPLVFLGPLLILAGILQLVRTYFEFDPATGVIVVRALAGPATRRFGGAETGRLTIADGRIVFTRPDGRTRKVPVSPTLAKRDDWNAVLARLS